MRWFAFGAGALFAFMWLESIGRSAMAKEQVACRLRSEARARRDAAWKAAKR